VGAGDVAKAKFTCRPNTPDWCAAYPNDTAFNNQQQPISNNSSNQQPISNSSSLNQPQNNSTLGNSSGDTDVDDSTFDSLI